MAEAAQPLRARIEVPPAAAMPASQLRLMRDQLRRSPVVVLLIDVFLAWLLLRSGSSAWIVAWVVLSSLLQLGRLWDIQRLARHDHAPTPAEARRVQAWFFVLGVVRAWPVLVAFQNDDAQLHFIVTLVTIGSAAGGLGSAAGLVKAYAAWVVPLGAVQIGVWLRHADFEGRWIGGLLALMLALLVANVRSYGRTLQQLEEEVARVNSEHRRAEAERQRADEERQRAETAVLARTRFFAAASHDLRQPLGVLRWYGDAVRLHADRLGHAPLQDIGDGIARALAHAEPLVRKYLDIARIEAGALELAPRTLALQPLLLQLREGFAPEAAERDLHIDLQLGPLPERLAVATDEDVLRSILDNLVGNAVKFTPAGGRITLRVQAIEGEGRRMLRLAVRDTGIGIAPADQQRVFDDFFQVANPERNRSKGMGLGLAIARRQAALLGTSIHVVSTPGQGSTFEFDLPAASLDAVPPGSEAAATNPWPGPHGGPLRVLVIDDEPEICQALTMMLEAAGWQARGAGGLAEARSAWQCDPRIDALVVDYRLRGGETGVAVVQALRADGCTAPAVLLTGDTSPDILRQLADTGLPVLHKPVAGAVLASTVLDQLSREH